MKKRAGFRFTPSLWKHLHLTVLSIDKKKIPT